MRFNVWFLVDGPDGVQEIPYPHNPIPALDLRHALDWLKDALPRGISLDLDTVGMKIFEDPEDRKARKKR